MSVAFSDQPKQKITGRDTRASVASRFLRPFNGCVPQPEKKRRLFDSHNPNSLMVAELRALYQSSSGSRISLRGKAKKSTLAATHRTSVSSVDVSALLC